MLNGHKFVEVSDVVRVFGTPEGEVRALDGVSFDVRQGEFLSIVGPSGCGKSTLAMLIAGLMRPTSGLVAMGGRTVDRPQTDLGIVFQNAVLLAWRSALDNVYFADKPIKGPKDLEGKKVSFTAGDSIHQAFQALLKVNSVDKSKVQEVYFDPRGKMTAVMAGQVDAMGGYYTTQAGQLEEATKKKAAYFRYVDFGVNALSQGLLINTRYLGEKDLNCRMVRASSKAWMEAARNPEEAARILVEMFPKAGAVELNLSQWKDTVQLMYTANTKGKTAGWMAAADWDTLLGLQKTYGNIQTKAPAEYYTNEFFDCK